MKKWIAIILAGIMAFSLAACSGSSGSSDEAATSLAKIDNSKWLYNAAADVYYQTGISYCETPADESYENLAVFVPGAYMDVTDNGDGTYTCELNDTAEVNGYTASTAPIVMPINTPGYSAQSALTDYTDVSEYMQAGFIYVHAGCRGRDEGAPAGVTDIKAAIRYIRYCDDELAGDAESIFTFGMSGGGAQSAVVGSTGDSELYNAYLEQIGAVMETSDAVLGSMCWCPITNLDTADEAYEWMLGSTRSGLSEDEQQISDKLAEAFAEYVNQAGFTDADGNKLTLETSGSGIYQSGSYYDYMKSIIEESLNNFLADTEFPYDADASSQGHMAGMGNGGGPGDGNRPDFGNGEKPDGMPRGEAPTGADDGSAPDMENAESNDNISRNGSSGSGLSLSGTYESAQDYIDALNMNGEWVTYDADTNTATITSIADYVSALKNASKSLGAFDQLDSGQGENTLFGYGDGNGAHFDQTLAEILNELGSNYTSAYEEDLEKTDSAGNTASTRLDMYTPLYYLLKSEDGYNTSAVAKYWRIRTGINQSDCALSTEVDLALALEKCDQVSDVDFETVWGQGHTMAERTGSSTENFITWINTCMGRI